MDETGQPSRAEEQFSRDFAKNLSSNEILPVGWQEACTEQGEVYYWNTETDETQWERPETEPTQWELPESEATEWSSDFQLEIPSS